jgi:hypothetical protein
MATEHDPQALCSTCGQSWQWHVDHTPRHEFTNPGEESRVKDPPPPVSAPRVGDPVLRLALIKAGVITELNLEEAQMWMNEAVVQGKAVMVAQGEYKLVDFAEMVHLTIEARK